MGTYKTGEDDGLFMDFTRSWYVAPFLPIHLRPYLLEAERILIPNLSIASNRPPNSPDLLHLRSLLRLLPRRMEEGVALGIERRLGGKDSYCGLGVWGRATPVSSAHAFWFWHINTDIPNPPLPHACCVRDPTRVWSTISRSNIHPIYVPDSDVPLFRNDTPLHRLAHTHRPHRPTRPVSSTHVCR